MATSVKVRKEKAKAKASSSTKKWWRTQAGRFANNPVFDEAMELGRAMRESSKDMPSKPVKSRARTRH
jgi:hypothetical protein